MQVKLPQVNNHTSIQCGDIVVISREVYLIMETGFKYIAKNLNGVNGAVGEHVSIESLHKALKEHDFEHYSKMDFKLELIKK